MRASLTASLTAAGSTPTGLALLTLISVAALAPATAQADEHIILKMDPDATEDPDVFVSERDRFEALRLAAEEDTVQSIRVKAANSETSSNAGTLDTLTLSACHKGKLYSCETTGPIPAGKTSSCRATEEHDLDWVVIDGDWFAHIYPNATSCVGEYLAVETDGNDGILVTQLDSTVFDGGGQFDGAKEFALNTVVPENAARIDKGGSEQWYVNRDLATNEFGAVWVDGNGDLEMMQVQLHLNSVDSTTDYREGFIMRFREPGEDDTEVIKPYY